MLKLPANPLVEELTKSHRERQFSLGDLAAIKLEDGSRKCIWCLETLKGKKLKWCSETCSDAAMAWFYPQQEWGLHVLLARQDFKCNICAHSYMPEIEASLRHLNRNHKTVDPSTIKTKISSLLMRVFKQRASGKYRPEVDHIIPIYKGGTSLGLDNHQAICFTCHKAKSKVDNSGPRKKEK